jgi:archaellum component FlaC
MQQETVNLIDDVKQALGDRDIKIIEQARLLREKDNRIAELQEKIKKLEKQDGH